MYSGFLFVQILMTPLSRPLNYPALAPSSTFVSVAVASPAKLQAAAALAEVANGIEGGVSHSFISDLLLGQFNSKEEHYILTD